MTERLMGMGRETAKKKIGILRIKCKNLWKNKEGIYRSLVDNLRLLGCRL